MPRVDEPPLKEPRDKPPIDDPPRPKKPPIQDPPTTLPEPGEPPGAAAGGSFPGQSPSRQNLTSPALLFVIRFCPREVAVLVRPRRRGAKGCRRDEAYVLGVFVAGSGNRRPMAVRGRERSGPNQAEAGCGLAPPRPPALSGGSLEKRRRSADRSEPRRGLALFVVESENDPLRLPKSSWSSSSAA